MASLQSSEGAHRCGGSVIHAEWVLTARHCIEGITDPTTVQPRIGSATHDAGGTVVQPDEIVGARR